MAIIKQSQTKYAVICMTLLASLLRTVVSQNGLVEFPSYTPPERGTTPSASGCPSVCRCDETKRETDCSRGTLQSLPQGIPQYTEQL